MGPIKNRPIIAVLAAELKSFWGGSAAGVTLTVFLGLLGFFYYNSLVAYIGENLAAAGQGLTVDASIVLFSQGLTNIPLVLMLVTPLVTMRLLSPFRRGGSLDFLQTLPLGPTSLILGQYLAAFISLAGLCILALVPFTILLALGIGQALQLAVAGVILLALAASFASVGLLFSAISPSPVGAGLGTLGGLGLMWVLGWAIPYAENDWGLIWRNLAFAQRLGRSALGFLDLNDLWFFLCLTVLALVNARLWLRLRLINGAN